MNKQQIQEIVDMFELSSDASKSTTNRMESALTKSGSASSRLSMAGSSLGALRDKFDEETSDYASLNALSSILKFASVLGTDNKKAQAEPKAKREQWHDADSAEAQAILSAKAPKKPRKQSVKVEGLNDADIIAQLLEALKVGR